MYYGRKTFSQLVADLSHIGVTSSHPRCREAEGAAAEHHQDQAPPDPGAAWHCRVRCPWLGPWGSLCACTPSASSESRPGLCATRASTCMSGKAGTTSVAAAAVSSAGTPAYICLEHRATDMPVARNCLVELPIVRVDDLSHFLHLLLGRLKGALLDPQVQLELLMRTQVQPRRA